MTAVPISHPRAERAAIIFALAAFAVLSVIGTLQLYVARVASHETATVGALVLMGSATWITWAVLAPLILWLGRQFDFRRGRRPASVLVHTAVLLVGHVFGTLLVVWLGYRLFSPNQHPTAAIFRNSILTSSRLQLSLLIYGAILGLGYAFRIVLTLRERELQATRLEAQAMRARLETLATRLQPHFLFNTLHTIGALIDEDPRLARTVLTNLGALLRDVLAEPGGIEVPLRTEVVLLRRYLDIEQLRFADRLRVSIEVPDRLGDALVPRLLLQPLVENALRHGIAPQRAGGTVRLTAAETPAGLVLHVWNDGAALSPSPKDGVGLATTRERLATRHGDAATLSLHSAGGGVETVVTMPLVRGIAG